MTSARPAPPHRRRLVPLVKEMSGLAAVGTVGYVIDIGLFNLLRTFSLPGLDRPLLEHNPIAAKAVAVLVSALISFYGNRYLTYRDRLGAATAPARGPQMALFLATNGVGLLVSVLCLAVSHHLLGLTSPLADNISANVVGVILSNVLRWFVYREWIFPPDRTAR